MKVLVATHETQGERANDFAFVPDGELVFYGTECDREQVDGHCGCRRALCGAVCLTGTTTVKVAERDLTLRQYEDEAVEALRRGGWLDIPNVDLESAAREGARELAVVALGFPLGTVLERRGPVIQERSTAVAA